MKNNTTVSSLYYLFKVGFYLTMIILLFGFSLECFTSNGKYGNFFSGNHHSKGYAFPVSVQTSIPDSIITYKSGAIANYYKDSDFGIKTFDSVQNVITNNIKIWPDYSEGSRTITPEMEKNLKVSFNSSIITSDGYATINSKDFWIKALLILRNYITIICIAIIFYLLMIIFKQLRKKIDFNPTLITKTRAIGLILISSELIRLFLVYILKKNIHHIKISSFLNGENLDNSMFININPRFDFNITFFLLGNVLIILSILFSKGYSLRQESDLTI